jgi:peptidoglycan/xylan/chitin deacetylase (PgdA/CDA1 family)
VQQLTVVTYHYVRPLVDTKHPRIRGLDLKAFRRQLDFLESAYSIVSSEDVIAAVVKNKSLPKNPCWLTFDDGYKDHYTYVLPELLARKLSAAFFPTRMATKEPVVLDVNAIHYILGYADNASKIVADINEQCILRGLSSSMVESSYKSHGNPTRFDDSDTAYIKRMLQYVLPEAIRSGIISVLLDKYVGIPEKKLSADLYMSSSEVSELVKAGMFVGSHGSMHLWLDRVSYEVQKNDISDSLEFLEEVGAATSNWIMCYPHGAYSDLTRSLISEMGASVGVTVESRKAVIGVDDPLALPRLDTNDFRV